jgi:hypothetical protein
MDLVQQLEFLLRLLLIIMTMESEDKTIPEWCTIECEKIVEEIAPGFKCIKNAITGEILAFIHEELDDDMLDEQADE